MYKALLLIKETYMKIKDNFELVEVLGEWIIIPSGIPQQLNNKILSLSESAVTLWNILDRHRSEIELINVLVREYGITEDVATCDVQSFIKSLQSYDLIEQ